MRPPDDTTPPARFVFTPKQVASALGVSESSVKRWVDAGKLHATKTLGGHRKISLNAVSHFVRESGQDVPQPELIGMAAAPVRCEPNGYLDLLYRRLIAGDSDAVRKILVGLYQGGVSIPELGDQLLSPTLRRMGEGWSKGAVAVHQERQSVMAVSAALHEVRLMLPPPAAQAPKALCATPYPDFAEIPVRLLEMTLQAQGWRTVMAGPGLPLTEILSAVHQHQPSLVCLSASHLMDAQVFLEGLSAQLAAGMYEGRELILGGSAIEGVQHGLPSSTRIARRLADLDAYLNEANPHEQADASLPHTPQGVAAHHMALGVSPTTAVSSGLA